MFDYFREYSSNANHVCCEDSPSYGLYGHRQSDDLALYSRSQMRVKRDIHFFYHVASIIAIYRTIFFSYVMHTWNDGRLMRGIIICIHALFDDLDLDARSQWVGKGKTPTLNYLNN